MNRPWSLEAEEEVVVKKLFSKIVTGPFNKNVVFLHGNLSSHIWWEPLLQQSQSGTAKHILIDWRGCGESPYWKEGDSISIKDLANDVVHSIQDLLANNESFVLVGHSLGGLLSSLVASSMEDRVEGLYLLDPVSPKGIQFGPEMYQAIEAMGQDRELTQTVLLSTIYQENLDNDFKEQITDHGFKAVKNIGQEVLNVLKNTNIVSDLANLNLKTKVVWGEFDNIIPKEDAQLMAASIKNSEFFEVKNQGHCWNLENPVSFYKDLSSFITAL